MHLSEAGRKALHAILINSFSLSELQSACFELDIDYELFVSSNTGKVVFAQKLVSYLEAEDKIPVALVHLAHIRPNLLDQVSEILGEYKAGSKSTPRKRVTESVNQLRAPVFDFVGRNNHLHALDDLVNAGTNIICIFGMAGSGKTELAIKFASTDRFSNFGIKLLVDPLTRSTQSESESPTSLSRLQLAVKDLGVPLKSISNNRRDLVNNYLARISEKSAVIILDDVYDADEIRLFSPPSGSLLIATSCFRFPYPTIELAPLDVEDATELIVRNAPRITREAASKISMLCDCLPTAVRQAASLLSTLQDLDPERFVEEMQLEQTRLTKLHGYGHDATIEAVFESSYVKLSESAQANLNYLSIFDSTFDMRAGLAIIDSPDLASISNLVRQSWLTFESERKVYQFYRLQRIFLRSKSDRQAQLVATQRYANHYLTRYLDAERTYQSGTGRDQAVAEFHAIWPHMYKILCAAHQNKDAEWMRMPHVTTTGLIDDYALPPEKIRIYSNALEGAIQEKVPVEIILANRNIAKAFLDVDEVESAKAYIDAAECEVERQLLDSAMFGIAELTAIASLQTGRIVEAKESYKKWLASIDNSSPYKRSALNGLAYCHQMLGEIEAAIAIFQDVLYLPDCPLDLRAIVLNNIGYCYLCRDIDVRSADIYLSEALTCATAFATRAEVLQSRMEYFLACQQYTDAISLGHELLAMPIVHYSSRLRGNSAAALALAYAQLGELNRAQTFSMVAQQSSVFLQKADMHATAAIVALLRGDISQSTRCFELSRKCCDQLVDQCEHNTSALWIRTIDYLGLLSCGEGDGDIVKQSVDQLAAHKYAPGKNHLVDLMLRLLSKSGRIGHLVADLRPRLTTLSSVGFI